MARRSGGVRQMQPPQWQGRGVTNDNLRSRRLDWDKGAGMAIGL
jgi:hypothetical protein